MISDTITKIQEAEAKARSIIEDAEAKSIEIKDTAKKDAKASLEESIEKAKANAKAEMDELKRSCDEKKEQEKEELQKEVNGIKALAETKEDSAVDLIIKDLLPD